MADPAKRALSLVVEKIVTSYKNIKYDTKRPVPEENVIFAVIERQVQVAENTEPPVYGKSRDFNIFG